MKLRARGKEGSSMMTAIECEGEGFLTSRGVCHVGVAGREEGENGYDGATGFSG